MFCKNDDWLLKYISSKHVENVNTILEHIQALQNQPQVNSSTTLLLCARRVAGSLQSVDLIAPLSLKMLAHQAIFGEPHPPFPCLTYRFFLCSSCHSYFFLCSCSLNSVWCRKNWEHKSVHHFVLCCCGLKVQSLDTVWQLTDRWAVPPTCQSGSWRAGYVCIQLSDPVVCPCGSFF